MAYNPNNPNGQATKANSAPVVIASDNIVSTSSTLVEGSTGGASTFHLVSAATTNASNISNLPGKITGWYIYNTALTTRKVNFYDMATTPNPATNVPKLALVIPPSSGANCSFPAGINFPNLGISISTTGGTGGVTDLDANPVALNDLVINVLYKS